MMPGESWVKWNLAAGLALVAVYALWKFLSGVF